MPIEKPNKLVDLSVAFAVEILNLVKYLKEQRETIISNQIGRAGTSIGYRNVKFIAVATPLYADFFAQIFAFGFRVVKR